MGIGNNTNVSQHRDAIQEVAETEFYAQFDYKPRTNHVRARARSKRMVKFSRACIYLCNPHQSRCVYKPGLLLPAHHGLGEE